MTREAQQKTVLSWLKDAHALEVGALPNLEDHLSAAEGYPELQSKLQEHLEATRRHAELVEGCIGRLGGQPAALKETLSSVMGKVTGVANLPAKDTVIKNALGDYAAEGFEIASYASLVAGAETLGDGETADVCRQILQDEKEMADWLEGYIPTLTEQYLAQVESAPDTQEKLEQTARDLSSRGKEAASNVDAKNTLLASGAILAGAGAALLVGQALRGRSDRDNHKGNSSDQNRTTDQTALQTDLGTADLSAADSGAADLGVLELGAADLDLSAEDSLTGDMATADGLAGEGLAGEGLAGEGLAGDVATGAMYDGYVTEVEVGGTPDPLMGDSLTESLLEPEPGTADSLNIESLNTDNQADLGQELGQVPQDAEVELVYTEAWLAPGLYTGVGPKNSESSGDKSAQEVFSRLSQHGHVDASMIEIMIVDGEVLLEGTVDSEETKRLAEEAVESVAGVTKVQNSLQVGTTEG